MLPVVVLHLVVLLSVVVLLLSVWRLTRAVNREAQRREASARAALEPRHFDCRCVAHPLDEPEPIPDTLRDGQPAPAQAQANWRHAIETAEIEARARAMSDVAILVGAADLESPEDAVTRVVAERDALRAKLENGRTSPVQIRSTDEGVIEGYLHGRLSPWYMRRRLAGANEEVTRVLIQEIIARQPAQTRADIEYHLAKIVPGGSVPDVDELLEAIAEYRCSQRSQEVRS